VNGDNPDRSLGPNLAQVRELENPDYVYEQVIRMLVRMAEYGLVHCDLNEFNLMVDEDENVTMIDFPQMVSVSHPNAKMYFERDAQCLRIYFARKFGVSEETGLMPLPVFEGAEASHPHTHGGVGTPARVARDCKAR
jgi:RIO-like serine/threonine protein kinase